MLVSFLSFPLTSTSEYASMIQRKHWLKNIHIRPVTCSSADSFVWDLDEAVYLDMVASIHSLGYCNNEIHFDRGIPKDKTSVYCVVSV
mgnify:CR=1 FL=1